ncbi:FAD-dependent oxidoreductase [Streptomyces coffeae]|uniref:FAD-dependent monooxygenase n=1 Tax=Streptomyces coffeae TaxID=621382 RepID=A0ABS1N5T0_9ACTN|nr:FAD-dependent oxidoreductase [Streptomyces coffeae]MBL1095431.1 FAD-dependent monooxygenase [Streptomyces coffeae]
MVSEIETDVVIVGAGPTGLTLAYELALAGVRTVVLERLEERIRQVKGGTIQPRTAELLELRGLLEPMLRRTINRDPAGGHFAMLPVELDCTPWDTAHPYPIGLPQWEIEEVLEERATARGAVVRRGTEVSAVEQDANGVTVRTAEGVRIRARYAVACDGARSTVRKRLGLDFPGRPGTYLAVLADIRLSSASSLVPHEAGHISTLTRQTDDYWAMLVPLGEGRYRLTFGHEEAETDRDTPVSAEEISTALRAVYGEETVLGGVDNSSRFTDATRQIENYRMGRVLFAGDAAHIHPPLGGQGLNLGVQDAFNLGWKLAAVVRGDAPDGLLDSYQTERHPVAARVLHHTSAQRVLANPFASPDVSALRDIMTDLLRMPDTNRHLAGLMSGLALRYDLPGAHPLTGARLPDAELSAPAGPIRLSGLFEAGHAVLLDLAGVVPEEMRLPERVDLVRARPEGAGPEAGALLIRPDGYVCWAADDVETCRTTLLPALSAHFGERFGE